MSSFDPVFEVLLEKSGRIVQVEEYTLTQDFIGSTDSFQFQFWSPDPSLMTGLEMQPVQLMIDGRTQLIGRIDATEQGEQGSAISCEGRDYISDLVECNVDPKMILREGMTLQQAILLLCSTCGISAVETPGERISARTGKTENIALHKLTAADIKDFKPTAGRGVYETAEELLSRFGLTLQSASKCSAVAIQPPTYDQDPLGRLVRTVGNPEANTILSGKARRDYSSFPTHCLFTGKAGGAAEVGGAKGGLTRWDMSEVVSVFPEEIRTILDGAIVNGYSDPNSPAAVADGQLYRLLYFQDQIGKTSQQNAHAMMRAIADRLKETLTYSCTVRGHTNPVTGYSWTPDTIVDIDDDMANVHEPLWCKSVTFANRKKGGGPTTTMQFLRPSTFQIYSED